MACDQEHREVSHMSQSTETKREFDHPTGSSKWQGVLSNDSLLIVNRMVTKMSPLNRYFPLVGLETRLSKARPYCYVLLLVVFVLVYAHMNFCDLRFLNQKKYEI